MATATGWGALPISMSFGDSIKELVAELNGPVAKAAKNAGGSIETEIGNASKKAADQYEKQQWRMEKATKEKTAAEENHRLKLLEQQRAQTALENAEKDLADAREAGGKKARDAQLRYEAAQIKVEKATIATRKASDKLDDSIDEVSKATESAEQAFKDMEKAQDDTGNSAKSLRDRVREMGEEAGETGGIFEGLGGKIGGALKGLAIGGVASIGAASAGLVKFGSDFDDAFDTIRIGTGASGEAFEDLKESAKSVADSVPAMDGGFGQISSTLADLNTRLGLTGEPLEAMTGQFVQLANMGIDADINDVSQALSGFGVEATDAPAALDELFQISQATGLTITELSNSAVKAGPALRGFGFGLGESAALAGQLDKAGLDADKTMASMTRALTEFASEGRDAPAALQETVDQIDSFIASGNDAAALDLAAGLFGTRGASQFVDAVKTGTLSVEDLVGATGATSDTIMGVAEETADFAESWQLFKQKSMDAIQPVATALFDSLAPALERASEWIFDQLVPAMSDLWENIQPLVEKGFVVLSDALDDVWRVVSEDLVPTFQRFIGWMKDNREVLQSVAVGAGVVAGGLALMNVQQKILMAGGVIKWMKSWTVATNIQATAQRLLNTVMKANPIGLIITAVAALAAGLTYFFTKTETGRELWDKFTTALGDGWDWVTEKFSAGIEWITEKWDEFTAGFSDAWETIKSAVFDVFIWYINRVKANFELVTGAINTAWTWLKDTLVSVWTNIRDAVFAVFTWYINRLKNTFELVTGAINSAWTWLKDMLASVWNTIRDAVFTAFNNAIENVRDIFDRVTGAISDAWTWLKDQLHAGWTWIDENVFDAIGRGLDTVKGWFQTGVDGIRDIWDGLKSAAAKPVKFVVDTVWNKGILAAWNSIADFLPGIDTKEAIPLGDLGAYATGGVLPGWSPGRDIHEFVSPTGGRIHLSGGEAIMRPEWTRAVGGPAAVEKMNRAARSGNLDESQIRIGRAHGFLGGFASGGVIGAMADIVRQKYGNILQLTSDYRPGHGPYHGTRQATDWSNGSGNTPEQLALAHDIAKTYPGSAELIYDSPGWTGNIKHGSNVGPFGQFYTMAQAGPHHHHVHWAMTTPPTMPFGGGVFEGGSNGGGIGAAVFNWIADRARGVWSKLVEPIKDSISAKMADFGDSAFAKIPGEMFSSLKDAAWSKISSLFGAGGGSSSGSVDVSDISGPIVDQVEMVFARHGFTGADWEAAKWIIQRESGWNPNAVNPSSGAYGLFQFNPMGGNTLGAYLPDRNPDPAVQADAGARYMKDRYGTPSAAKAFWEQNQWYADGGIVDLPKLFDTGGVWRDGTMGVNLSGSDEVVFNNRQWQLLKQVLNTVPMLTDSQEMMVKEIGAAFLGTDIGYAELATALGSEKLAQQVTDIAFLLGDISRDTEVMAAAQEFQEQTRKSAEDYASEQASGVLSTFGLEGLVPLGLKAGEKAAEAYAANPVDVSMSPNGLSLTARTFGVQADMSRRGATVVIEAESDDDLIRVKQFKKLAEQVDGLEVQVKRKPKAAVRTRGGVM